MSWATRAIKELQEGRPVTVCPRGNSMSPKVKSGASVDLEPISNPDLLRKGEIVLVRVSGYDYLHLITASDERRVQIGNNRGKINGWVSRSSVYGRAVAIHN